MLVGLYRAAGCKGFGAYRVPTVLVGSLVASDCGLGGF